MASRATTEGEAGCRTEDAPGMADCGDLLPLTRLFPSHDGREGSEAQRFRHVPQAISAQPLRHPPPKLTALFLFAHRHALGLPALFRSAIVRRVRGWRVGPAVRRRRRTAP